MPRHDVLLHHCLSLQNKNTGAEICYRKGKNRISNETLVFLHTHCGWSQATSKESVGQPIIAWTTDVSEDTDRKKIHTERQKGQSGATAESTIIWTDENKHSSYVTDSHLCWTGRQCLLW